LTSVTELVVGECCWIECVL